MTTELAAFECLNFVVVVVVFFNFFSVAIYKILFKLVCNEEIHNILNDFKFKLHWTTDCEVSCP